ncbi:MAG: nucleotidyltransferase family protein [Salinibacter sp.]
MPLPDEDLERYRQTLRRRNAADREQQTHARRQAHNDAQRAATLLKTDFGADRVVLFGSVVRDERLSPHSDLDLAIAGVSGIDYYRAVARVQSVSEERSVDLVRLESCRHSLRQRIDESGIEL